MNAIKPYYSNESVTLYKGDCLTILPQLSSDGPFADMVFTDPPYGITDCAYDKKPVDVNLMFAATTPCLLPERSSVFFCNFPLAVKMFLAKPKEFKFQMIYAKLCPTGFLNANVRPLIYHELMMVFGGKHYKKCYNPDTKGYIKNRIHCSSEVYKGKERRQTIAPHRLFGDVLVGDNRSYERSSKHPSAKPCGLLAVVIKMFTRPGETVLDPFAGGGSTGIAAMREGRKAILIEKDPNYCDMIVSNLEAEGKTTPQTSSL